MAKRKKRFKASETLLGIETGRANGQQFAGVMIQSLWNPFRDWNCFLGCLVEIVLRFKASETLLGIETNESRSPNSASVWFKASETLLGIETSIAGQSLHSQLLAIQSLWNPFRDWNSSDDLSNVNRFNGFKASETLLGIETSFQSVDRLTRSDSKPLKPF